MKSEICPACEWKQKIPHERLINWLLMKIIMQDNGCPLGRNELRNQEWIWLGIVKNERAMIAAEEAKSADK